MNSDNLVGITLGNRYDMLEKIGTGGMATVYKAKDTLLNRNVAIKILRDSLEEEKNVVSNFIKEAQSSASLVHNNIVSVYDVGEENGLNYMVMEYVDGITLKEYIKHKGELPWQEACDFALQIGQGINEAHSINIIHRDIKPQNILMTKDKTLKVTDFGIARAVAGETTVVGGSALGSVHYISPEQARGGFTDARSDLYSLGIVLYEMLTGKVPFDGDTAVSVALMHLEKEPVNVKCVNLDIPTDLAYVTMKAISKEQSARYANVQEFLNDLHAVLADEPLPSREDVYKKTLQEDGDDIDVVADYDEDSDEITGTDFGDEDDIIEEELEPRGRTKRKTVVKKKSKKQKKEDTIASVLAVSTVLVVILLVLGGYFLINMTKEASVPDFTNLTIEQAKTEADKAGLRIADEIEYSLSDTVAENCVISQDPTPNKVVKKNSEVKLIVSIGSSGGNIATPNVVNNTFEEAVTVILEAGLNYTVTEQESDDVPDGRVIRQTPLAGTKLNKDDIVNLHISKGKSAQATPAAEKISVPSIIGLGKDQAEATLQANGLNIGNVSRKASSAPEGTVISQSPELGKTALKGSFVSVVLSRGPEAEGENAEAPTVAPEQPSDNSEIENTGDNSGSSNEGNTSNVTSTRTFSVKIPETANDTVEVEIVVNGVTHHKATHSKEEGSVYVDITGSGTAQVQAYIDGSKVSDKPINFN